METEYCEVCGNELLKEIKKIEYEHECGYCRSGFGGGECECYWNSKDILMIRCLTCEERKGVLKKEEEFEREKRLERMKFNMMWKKMDVEEKLEICGVKKLRVLCKNKSISGYSKMTKEQLVEVLSSITNHEDFPIKPKTEKK